MTKKTFNTAELFISSAPETAKENKESKNVVLPIEIDIHAGDRAKEEHIRELTQRAIELERQAKSIKSEATKAKREAVAAANAKYRGKVTTRFRQHPDYDNPRTRRAQILLRQDLYDSARKYCEDNKISFNRLIEIALFEHLRGGIVC